jgi:predicted enzyme related to lactoylglutathione lyase
MSFQRRQWLQAMTYAFGAGFMLPRHTFAAMAQNAAQPTHPQPPAKAAANHDSRGTDMEKVAGIGGLFFRAHDPQGLTKWYQEHLGVSPTPTKAGDIPWEQEAGTTAFSPFSETTKYFDASKRWMINFRVHNLDRMVAQLRKAGIEVEVNPDESYGSFARLHDPEGNPIELWQPA